MGHDFDVVLGAVKVCKDKRCLIIAKTRTVAAALLALRGKQIHEFIFNHVVEELGCLGGAPLVELLCHRDNVIRRACGFGFPERNSIALSA